MSAAKRHGSSDSRPEYGKGRRRGFSYKPASRILWTNRQRWVQTLHLLH